MALLMTILMSSCLAAPQAEIPSYTRQANLKNWSLKAGTLNVYGLKVLSGYKKERMPAIGKSLEAKNLDFAFIQEAWTKDGRKDIIKNSTFPYQQYWPVKWTVGSGLLSLSRHPMEAVSFLPFTLDGKLAKIKEGDAFSGKGVSKTTIKVNGMPVSMFNLHTVARQTPGSYWFPEDVYTPERLMSLFEIFTQVIEQTDSDAFIVGGDFNMRYLHTEYQFWLDLTSLDGLRLEEQDKSLCTSCGDNTFRLGKFDAQVDYFFVSPRLKIDDYKIEFKEKVPVKKNKVTSLSDHYGLTATFSIVPTNPDLNPEGVKQRTLQSIKYLRERLERYLAEYHSFRSEAEIRGGIPDRFCVRCRIRDSIKKTSFYEQALAANDMKSLSAQGQFVRQRLESYFELFK